jgi:hypothetical protein
LAFLASHDFVFSVVLAENNGNEQYCGLYDLFMETKKIRDDHALELSLLKMENEEKAIRDRTESVKASETLRVKIQEKVKLLEAHRCHAATSGNCHYGATDAVFSWTGDNKFLLENIRTLNQELEAKSVAFSEHQASTKEQSKNYEKRVTKLEDKLVEQASVISALRRELEVL